MVVDGVVRVFFFSFRYFIGELLWFGVCGDVLVLFTLFTLFWELHKVGRMQERGDEINTYLNTSHRAAVCMQRLHIHITSPLINVSLAVTALPGNVHVFLLARSLNQRANICKYFMVKITDERGPSHHTFLHFCSRSYYSCTWEHKLVKT